MKRLFILASAAIVALAACTKTEVVYNEAPQEIGFKAVPGSMTKAVQTKADFIQDMGVIAYKHGEANVYFNNSQFKKPTNGATWNGVDTKYWPIDSSLDFFVYSPFQDTGVSVTFSPSTTLTVDVPSNNAMQYDYLYSDTYITDKSKSAENVPVKFEHALAYVTVKFSGDNAIELIGAKLNGTYQAGTYTVTYGDETSIAWTEQDNTAGSLILDCGALTSDYTTSWLVVPEDNNNADNTITFDYLIDGMDGSKIFKEISLSETWQAGKHYTYDVKISANEIKFTVDAVAGWGEGTVSSNTTIN